MADIPTRRREALPIAQGIYYLATGVWPFVSPGTFQAVTGPKVDFWLVKTVGALVGVVGGVLALAALRKRVTPEIRLLGAGSALALAGVGLGYSAKGRISKVYAVDGVAELGIAGGWLRRRRAPLPVRTATP
jgi:hypothetical protein